MITSKQILCLFEDYLLRDGELEVFVNPSKSESAKIATKSKALYSQIRFIADVNRERLYVWDAYKEIHYHVRRLVGLDISVIKNPNLINGTINFTDGRVSIVDWTDDYDELLYNISQNNSKSKESKTFLNNLLNNHRWDWLNRYVSNGTAFINWKKKELEQGHKD